MKYLKLFEAICLDTYKKYQKYFNKKEYERHGKFFKFFDDHSKNYDRIYFPIGNISKPEYRIPQEIVDLFHHYNWDIDKEKEMVSKKSGNYMKIGKALQKLGKGQLLKVYADSKKDIMKDTSDLYVVISRHPYDLLGISTDRGWTTCLNLDDKTYNKKYISYLEHLIENGYLSAYLIHKDDRNIENPISRLLIKNHTYPPSVSFGWDNKIYGTHIKEFEDIIKKWISLYNQYLKNKSLDGLSLFNKK
jgi:hypothetical protein